MPHGSWQDHRHTGVHSETRVESLDGLRGIAIGLVLLFHCFLFDPQSIWSSSLRRVFGIGWIGVDLFFVLSGYLITGILIRMRDKPYYFRNFYARRALRIFPAYYLMLMLIFLGAGLQGNFAVIRDMPWFLFYVQNWMTLFGHGGSAWNGVSHLWSLAVEEQFYLLWPLLVWLTPRAAIGRLCLFTVVVGVVTKLVLWWTGASWMEIYGLSCCRIDALAFGAWIATLSPEQSWFWNRPLRLAGSLGAIALAALTLGGANLRLAPIYVVIGTIASMLAFGSVVFAIHSQSLSRRVQRMLGAHSLIWLGRYSYGIYLLHFPVYWIVRGQVTDVLPVLNSIPSNLGVLVVGLMTCAITFLLALAMCRWIEAPARRLKAHFEPAPDLPKSVVLNAS
jgi:peptidoglycan/LPS O-acetylase OafA/YrhL